MAKGDPTEQLAKAMYAATNQMPRSTPDETRAAYEAEARVAQAFFRQATDQYIQLVTDSCKKRHPRAVKYPCATCYQRVQIASIIGNVIAPEIRGVGE